MSINCLAFIQDARNLGEDDFVKKFSELTILDKVSLAGYINMAHNQLYQGDAPFATEQKMQQDDDGNIGQRTVLDTNALIGMSAGQFYNALKNNNILSADFAANAPTATGY